MIILALQAATGRSMVPYDALAGNGGDVRRIQ
jgi:hypothetical protein